MYQPAASRMSLDASVTQQLTQPPAVIEPLPLPVDYSAMSSAVSEQQLQHHMAPEDGVVTHQGVQPQQQLPQSDLLAPHMQQMQQMPLQQQQILPSPYQQQPQQPTTMGMMSTGSTALHHIQPMGMQHAGGLQQQPMPVGHMNTTYPSPYSPTKRRRKKNAKKRPNREMITDEDVLEHIRERAEYEHVSVQSVRDRLRIGYKRAKRLVDQVYERDAVDYPRLPQYQHPQQAYHPRPVASPYQPTQPVPPPSASIQSATSRSAINSAPPRAPAQVQNYQPQQPQQQQQPTPPAITTMYQHPSAYASYSAAIMRKPRTPKNKKMRPIPPPPPPKPKPKPKNLKGKTVSHDSIIACFKYELAGFLEEKRSSPATIDTISFRFNYLGVPDLSEQIYKICGDLGDLKDTEQPMMMKAHDQRGRNQMTPQELQQQQQNQLQMRQHELQQQQEQWQHELQQVQSQMSQISAHQHMNPEQMTEQYNQMIYSLQQRQEQILQQQMNVQQQQQLVHQQQQELGQMIPPPPQMDPFTGGVAPASSSMNVMSHSLGGYSAGSIVAQPLAGAYSTGIPPPPPKPLSILELPYSENGRTKMKMPPGPNDTIDTLYPTMLPSRDQIDRWWENVGVPFVESNKTDMDEFQFCRILGFQIVDLTKLHGMEMTVYVVGSRPKIWRKILIPSTANLGHLAVWIRDAFGWDIEDSGKYSFNVTTMQFEPPSKFHRAIAVYDETERDYYLRAWSIRDRPQPVPPEPEQLFTDPHEALMFFDSKPIPPNQLNDNPYVSPYAMVDAPPSASLGASSSGSVHVHDDDNGGMMELRGNAMSSVASSVGVGPGGQDSLGDFLTNSAASDANMMQQGVPMSDFPAELKHEDEGLIPQQGLPVNGTVVTDHVPVTVPVPVTAPVLVESSSIVQAELKEETSGDDVVMTDTMQSSSSSSELQSSSAMEIDSSPAQDISQSDVIASQSSSTDPNADIVIPAVSGADPTAPGIPGADSAVSDPSTSSSISQDPLSGPVAPSSSASSSSDQPIPMNLPIPQVVPDVQQLQQQQQQQPGGLPDPVLPLQMQQLPPVDPNNPQLGGLPSVSLPPQDGQMVNQQSQPQTLSLPSIETVPLPRQGIEAPGIIWYKAFSAKVTHIFQPKSDDWRDYTTTQVLMDWRKVQYQHKIDVDNIKRVVWPDKLKHPRVIAGAYRVPPNDLRDYSIAAYNLLFDSMSYGGEKCKKIENIDMNPNSYERRQYIEDLKIVQRLKEIGFNPREFDIDAANQRLSDATRIR